MDKERDESVLVKKKKRGLTKEGSERKPKRDNDNEWVRKKYLDENSERKGEQWTDPKTTVTAKGISERAGRQAKNNNNAGRTYEETSERKLRKARLTKDRRRRKQ